MHLVMLGEDIAWNAIVETFTEGGGFMSKHFGNSLGNPGKPLLSTGRSIKRIPSKCIIVVFDGF